jgi:hypothetical protein
MNNSVTLENIAYMCSNNQNKVQNKKETISAGPLFRSINLNNNNNNALIIENINANITA